MYKYHLIIINRLLELFDISLSTIVIKGNIEYIHVHISSSQFFTEGILLSTIINEFKEITTLELGTHNNDFTYELKISNFMSNIPSSYITDLIQKISPYGDINYDGDRGYFIFIPKNDKDVEVIGILSKYAIPFKGDKNSKILIDF